MFNKRIKYGIYYIFIVLIFLTSCKVTVDRKNIYSRSVSRFSYTDSMYTKRKYAGKYKVGSPYTINGIQYIPEEVTNYEEVGIASWYGKDFHGKKTANGDVFDMDAMTAAHKTLPLPSVVKVTNLENGRSVKLLVNDRGPFVEGRLIDVSKGAADILGFRMNGTAKVKIEFLESETKKFLRKNGFIK